MNLQRYLMVKQAYNFGMPEPQPEAPFDPRNKEHMKKLYDGIKGLDASGNWQKELNRKLNKKTRAFNRLMQQANNITVPKFDFSNEDLLNNNEDNYDDPLFQ